MKQLTTGHNEDIMGPRIVFTSGGVWYDSPYNIHRDNDNCLFIKPGLRKRRGDYTAMLNNQGT